MSPRQPSRACVANRKNLRDRGASPECEMKPAHLVEDYQSPGGGGGIDDEFQDPIPLDGIPEDLKERMVAVAPVLQGRHGVYDARFFTVVAGLCPRGTCVDQVLQQTQVTDAEIFEKWKTRSDPYRFPISLCVDNEQAKQFSEHYSCVYGGSPCNEQFSLRFLRACFATFVHKLEIDWVAEAIKRRNTRMDQKKLNRHKLGPVAIREQLASLCAIMNSFATTASGHKRRKRGSPTRKSSKAIAEAEAELLEFRKLRDQAAVAHRAILRSLMESKEALVTCAKDRGELEIRYAKGIHCNPADPSCEGTSAVSMQKLLQGRETLQKLITMSETEEQAKASIKSIEGGSLALSTRTYEMCKAAVVESEEKLGKLKSASLVLRPRAPFIYPTGKSVPEMWRTEPKFCAGCKKQGFVARAVIIASCGCEYHPVCIAQLLAEHKHICPRCEDQFSGASMAQFGYPLTSRMEKDVSNMITRLEAEAAAKLGEII